jgi:hypothetical protein
MHFLNPLQAQGKYKKTFTDEAKKKAARLGGFLREIILPTQITGSGLYA